ncbi:RHS repeat-associated core domain-containing protein [Pseudomonas syringae pv. syringae]|uniref:RHS repeat-associated core domain-containing protein n=1 Tax=Pseudomonas syringae TaxID=317 RepID=UPI003AFFE5CD
MTTATQTFTYADDGRLIKSVAADGVVTLWFYYPAKGGQASSVQTYFTADWPTEIPRLSAPAIADGVPRLLMAEYQYQPVGEWSTVTLNLTFYGYPDKPLRSMANIPDKLITLEGAEIGNLTRVLEDETLEIRVTRMSGRDKISIRYQTTEETPLATKASNDSSRYATGKTVVTERRYWGAEKTVLITTESRVWDTEQGLKTSLCSRNTDKDGADVALSSELRSPFSGRVLSYVRGNQQHRVSYDGLGRVTADTAYADDAKLNDQAARPDKKLSSVSIAYVDTQDSTWVTTFDSAQPDSRRQRTLYDGLQRPVRSELQRVGGPDLSNANFCVIQNRGQVLDYLPGGLRRLVDQSVVPSSDRDWFWVGDKEEEQTAPENALSQLRTEQTLASTRGIRVIREETQTFMKNSWILHRSVERTPQATDTAPARSRVTTDKSFNWLGRLDMVKQTSADPSEPERTFYIGYDDLGRPTTWVAPDGTRVKRTYSGMSDQVTRLSVQENREAKEIILGSQAVEMPARVAKQMVGKRNYQFDYTTEGRFSGVQMPDSTRLFSEESSDGRQVTYKAETSDADGKKTISTMATFSYDPLQRAITASRSDAAADKQLATDVAGSAPDLLGSSQYQRATSGLVFNALLQRSLLGDDYGTEHANGSQVVAYRDRLDRRTRVRRGNLEYYYRYSPYGECEQETVRDLKTGHTLAVKHEFDGFGQEVCRRYLLNGKEVEVYEQAWSGSGQLSGKKLTRDGKLCRSELFRYDSRGRLKNWTVDKATTDGPSDSSGKAVRSEDYVHDLLNNLTSCITLYIDGSKSEQTCSYSSDNPTQRIKQVTVDTPAPDKAGKTGNPTRTEAELNYDANGNLTQDDHGRKLLYTLSGRLQSVISKDGTLITRYEYDERDRLVAQWDEKAQQRRVLIYSGDQVCGEVWLDNTRREIKRLRLDEEAGLAIQWVTPDGQQTVFTLSDPLCGTSSEYSPDGQSGALKRSSVCFTPWGECASGAFDGLSSVLGFNGVRRDPLIGFYHLGNGYRVYNPSLRVFQQADSWSPFGAGGLNDYAYCSGDPVNLFDPDGHLMISRWGETQLMTRLDQLIQDMTPYKPPQQEVYNQGSLMSTIIWSGVAVLTAVAAVLLAVPTGGLSLVAAGVLLAATVVSCGLSIASVALQNSNPELADKLGSVALGIDLATMIIPVKAVLGAGGRMLRWAGSKVGQAVRRVELSLLKFRGRVKSALNVSKKEVMADGVRGNLWPKKIPGDYELVMDTSYQNVINSETGAEVWFSPAGVRARHVEKVTGDIIKRHHAVNKKVKVTVLSGTHGNPLGNRGYQNYTHPERGSWEFRSIPEHQQMEAPQFYQRDALMAGNYSGPIAEVKVVDVANYHLIPGTDIYRPMLSGEMAEILRGEDHVVVGFCFGANDRMVRDALGLPEVRTLVPDFLDVNAMYHPGSPPAIRRLPPLPC